jgi:cytochrome P450
MTQFFTTETIAPDFVLDLDDPAFIENPYPTYRKLREQAPRYDWRGGVVFTRYDDVKAILNDRTISPDHRYWEHAQPEQWPPELADYQRILDHGVFRLPSEGHTRVRKLVSASFTPRSIERMRGEIQRTVDAGLEATIAGDRLDVRAFADHLPLQVISDMLKIPAEMRVEFRAFGQASIRVTDMRLSPEQVGAILAPMPRWMGMLREVVAERRRHPLADDLLSSLIEASDGAAKLSEDELVSLFHALITAGSDTTVHALCWAIYTLLRYPAALAELVASPSLLRNAVEETLRFELFGKGGLPKFCREETEIAGARLRRGQMIFPFIPAALHDPAVFPEPERFDIHRDLTQTLAFSSGAHFCMGAALARLELEIAVGTLVRRFPHLVLVEPPPLEVHPLMRSMTKLEVQLHS